MKSRALVCVLVLLSTLSAAILSVPLPVLASPVVPGVQNEIEQSEALEEGFSPLREFMLSQTRPEDLQLFMGLSGLERPETPEEIAATTLIPAFVISELRAAFIIGFIIFVTVPNVIAAAVAPFIATVSAIVSMISFVIISIKLRHDSVNIQNVI